MFTFLEFVCERLMGPPVYGRSWKCPYHDDSTPSFTVRPPKKRPDGGEYPIKFCCHGCSAWGDEWDLIKRFYPKESQKQNVKRLDIMRNEFLQLTGGTAILILPGKRGQDSEALQFCVSELRSVAREQQRWTPEESPLRLLVWACHLAEQNGISLADLARYCASELMALLGEINPTANDSNAGPQNQSLAEKLRGLNVL